MQKTIKLSLFGVLVLTSLQAEEITLAPLEVTSTAIKTDELRATDAVEVYTQKDIENAHVQNIYEFLNKETSITTMPSYGNSFTQKIDMHGYGIGDGYQNIVIKVNGRKLNNVDMVPQLLASISPNQIERIEIIKSSGIVEGGDGANAGVINIVTKQSNEKSIGAYAGIYNTFDGNFYIGHVDDTLAYNISGEAQKRGGIKPVKTTGEKDSSKFSNFGFDLSYFPTDDLELRLNGQTSDIDTWYVGSMTKKEYDANVLQLGTKTNYLGNVVPSEGTHQIFSSDVIGTGLSYDISNDIAFNADFFHEYKTSEYPAYNYAARYVYNSYDLNLEYNDANFQAKTGLQGFNGDRRQTANKTSKDNLAAYAMLQYRLKSNTVKIGYRYEKVSYSYDPVSSASLSDDHKLNGVEVGYNYTFDKENSLFVNYTRSYQAPDIDRFFATTYPPPTYAPVVSFNGFIDPMKANNYTLGYNRISDVSKTKLSIYYIDLTDEIYYYNIGGANKNTNIDSSYKYGLDLYEKYVFNKKFNAVLNYNYVMAKIDKEIESGSDFSGKELPGVSNHSVKAVLNYLPNSKTTLSLTQVYRSEAYNMEDFGNSAVQKQDAYMTTDISATYKEKRWEVFAKINNLFNQKNGIWVRDDVIYPVNYTTTAWAGFKLKY